MENEMSKKDKSKKDKSFLDMAKNVMSFLDQCLLNTTLFFTKFILFAP